MAAISILISVLSASFKAPFQGCATKLGCKVKHLFPLYQDIFTLFHYTSHILTHFLHFACVCPRCWRRLRISLIWTAAHGVCLFNDILKFVDRPDKKNYACRLLINYKYKRTIYKKFRIFIKVDP